MSRRFLWPLVAVIAAGCSGPAASNVSLLPHSVAGSSGHLVSRARTGVGNTFVFTGTLTETSGASTTRSSVTQTIVVSATPYPYGSAPGAVDYHSVEVDRTGASSSSWVADAWRGNGTPRSGETPSLLYGSRIDEDGNVYAYRYPTPQIVDWSPAVNAKTWSNGGALNYLEKDANGTSAHAIYAAGGSYIENVTYPQACSSATCDLNVTARSDGSAAYTGSALTSDGVTSIALTAPAGGFLDVVYALTDGYQQSFGLQAWFASGAPLYSETDAIRTKIAMPASCAPSAGSTTLVDLVTRHIARIDPAAGYSETENTQTYGSPATGTLCVVLADTQAEHYDFSSGTFSGTPLSTTHVAEVLSLSLQRAATERANAQSLASAAISAFDWRMERLREQYRMHVTK